MNTVIKYLEELNKIPKDKTNCVYRGLSKNKHDVCSTYYRRFNSGKGLANPSADEFQMYHNKLLSNAKSYHYHKEKSLSKIELLAELQHFGAATGLIDFSKNFLVALWFASHSNQGENGKVSLLNKDNCIDYVENDDLYQNTLDSFCLIDLNFKSNTRIFAQNGVFIFSNRVFNNKLDLIEIEVDKNDKEKIITELEIFFNITESTLFQDIYGFSEVNNVRHPIKNSDFSRQAKHYMGIGGFKGLTKAIELYNLALKSDIKTYGEADPKVATIRNNLASALQATNQPQDLAKAIELYDLALKSDIKTYGESHLQVAVIKGNLASALKATNQPQDLAEAIELYSSALDSCIKTYGESHPKVAIIRNNLAHTLEATNQPQDLAKAIELYNLALESDIKTYGESHPKVAVIRCNLARALEARNQSQDLVEVIELRSLALESYIKTDGESHPEVAIIRHDLARALKARKQP